MFNNPDLPPNLPADKKPPIKKEEIFERENEILEKPKNKYELLKDKILSFISQEFSRDNHQEYFAKIGEEYKSINMEIAELDEEEQQKVMAEIKTEYLAIAKQKPENLKSQEALTLYNYTNWLLSEYGNGVEYLKFFDEMREFSRKNNLYSGYYDYGFGVLTFNAEKGQKDYLKVFENNNVEEGELILDYLHDTFLFSRAEEKDVEKFLNSSVNFLKEAKEKTSNYYLKISSERSLNIFEKAIEEKIYEEKAGSELQFGETKRSEWVKQKSFEQYGYDLRIESGKIRKALQKEKGKDYSEKGLLKDVNHISIFLDKIFRENLKKDIGIDLDIVPEEKKYKTYLYCLEFLKDMQVDEVEKYKKYFSGDGDKANRIKAFFALEVDADNGDKIMKIGEKLSSENSDKIFQKISEIFGLADKKNSELAEIIFKDSQKELPPSVRGELMRRAHNIISRFSDELKDGEKPDEEKIQKLLKDLEQIARNN